MSTLREAVEATSWRCLLVIGRRRGLHFSSNILKTDLVDRLIHTLSDPDNLSTALANLPEPERHALADLLAAAAAACHCATSAPITAACPR